MHLSLLFVCFFQIAVGSTVRPATAGAPEKGFSFVTARGCNTTCYPIHRSTSGSFLIVNGFSLFLRRSGSASVNLSLSVTGVPRCGVSALPNRRIDLTGSPFRVSNETCRDIAVLRPCVPDFRKCKLNEWEIEILSKPVRLFPGCENRYSGTARCSSSIPPELDRFLGSGIRVEWEEREYEPYLTRCKNCGVEKKLRRFNASESQFLCFESRKGNEIKADESKPSNKTAILTSLCAFMSLLLLAAAAVAIFRCKGLNLRSNAEEEDPTALFLHRHRSSNLLPPVFSYEEMEYSTNGFDPKRKIGDGGFGSVYLAQLADGRIVAVKKLHRRHATKSFSNEVLILSSIDHANLVKLHGYCCDRRGLLLVYDYVPNGTLADHLHGSKSQYRRISLTWPVRLDVAVQTAMAIEYLHFSLDPAVVHRDITSSNIFVEKDMRVRVGDFGLSRLLVYTESSPNCVWTGPQGTPGYLDPDYHRSYQLTEKSDIYSFGVVLLELLSGLKAVDLSREKRDVALADLVVAKIQSGAVREVVDPVLAVEGEGLMGSVHAVAELAFRCVAADKDDRPDAREVAAELKRIRMRIRDAIVGGVAGMG